MREIVKTFVAVDVPNELTCAGEKLTAYDPDAGPLLTRIEPWT